MSRRRFTLSWLAISTIGGMACFLLEIGAGDTAYQIPALWASGAVFVFLLFGLPTFLVCLSSHCNTRGFLLLCASAIMISALLAADAPGVVWLLASIGFPVAIKATTSARSD